MSAAFIDLQAQYRHLRKDIQSRIDGVLEHGHFIMGPEVEELEAKLAEFCGSRHAITCSSGTDALIMSLMALGVGQGDAVFTPTFTYIATAEAIRWVGATPVFVDIDARTFNMDPQRLSEAIVHTSRQGTLRARCILPVDLFGQPAPYPEILAIAGRHKLLVLGDSAQGFGSEIHGRKSTHMPDIATTSFFPAKPLGCYGDGGAIFTDNAEHASLLRSLRVHGKGSSKYDCVRLGMNARLDTLQAAILLAKLAVFETEITARNRFASRYDQELSESVDTPQVRDGYRSVWAQYSILAQSPAQVTHIQASLKKAGIPSAVYYEKCVHLQGAMADLGYHEGDFPVSEEVASRILSLPMHPYLQDEQISQTCEILRQSIAE